MAAPYVSIVVAARNDNHGGNMLARMQAFVDSWTIQAQLYRLESEIVVVEWNPPADRPHLAEVLSLPVNRNICDVRFIEVPADLHAGIPNSVAIPLHQMIAKNVGIRRARGQFVLATNLDIVCSRQLMEYLAMRRLESGVMYRLDRYDVSSDLPPHAAGVDPLLKHCAGHLLRVFTAENQLRREGERWVCTESDDIGDSGLDFGRGWMPRERQGDFRYRWIRPPARILFQRPAGECLSIDAEVGPSQSGGPLRVEVLDDNDVVVAQTEISGRAQLQLSFPRDLYSGGFGLKFRGRNVSLSTDLRMLHLRVIGLKWEAATNHTPGWSLEISEQRAAEDWSDTPAAPLDNIRTAGWLHVNACGDFTLMAREDWFHLRGYAEMPIWPLHIDTLLCYTAFHSGMREEVLPDPLRIYHIEHRNAAGWSPDGEEELRRRILARQVPVLDYDSDVVGWVQQMRRWDSPVIFNLENWGLRDQL